MFICFPSHYVSVSAVFPCFSTFLVTPQCIYCFCLPQSFVGAPVNPPMCLCVPGLEFSWLGPRLVWFSCFVQVWLSAKTKGMVFVNSSPAPITFVHKKQNIQKKLYAYNCINKYIYIFLFSRDYVAGGVCPLVAWQIGPGWGFRQSDSKTPVRRWSGKLFAQQSLRMRGMTRYLQGWGH